MPDISKIQLPGSGGIYNIKDAVAREMISGGVSFIVAWDGSEENAPTVSAIPAGVTVTYNNTTYTGTLDANDATPGAFYLVKSATQKGGTDTYDEYVPVGVAGSKTWEKIGDTQVDLSDVVTGVTLNKNADYVLGEDTTFTAADSSVTFSGGTNATVLGASTTFTAGSSSVTFTGGSSDNALGEDATFTTSVTPSTTYIGTSATDADFVTSVTAETNKNLVTTTITGTNGTESVSTVTKNVSKMVTTSVPNVTGNTDVSVPNITSNSTATANKSTWTFTMGSGESAETLIIGGGNGSDVTATHTTLGTANTASKVTLGNDITVATGSLSSSASGDDVLSGISITNHDVAKVASSATTVATGATAANGGGDAVVTGVTVGSTAKALTSVGLTSGSSSGSGKVQVATGITSATTTVNDGDVIAAVTSIGTGTAAAQNITVGQNDRQSVVKTLGTGTAAAQEITVGTNDKVNALTNQTTVNVTKGNQ